MPLGRLRRRSGTQRNSESSEKAAKCRKHPAEAIRSPQFLLQAMQNHSELDVERQSDRAARESWYRLS